MVIKRYVTVFLKLAIFLVIWVKGELYRKSSKLLL